MKYSKLLPMAKEVSRLSKDPSTKVGAVILGKDNTPITFGYNGMPRGFDDDDYHKNQRPVKYHWYEHAERNAVFNIARKTLPHDAFFLCRYMPNSEGVRAIIGSGVRKVIYYEDSPLLDQEGLAIALDLLKSADVDIVKLCHIEDKSKEKYQIFIDMMIAYQESLEIKGVPKGHVSAIFLANDHSMVVGGIGVLQPPLVKKWNSLADLDRERLSDNKGGCLIEPEKMAVINSLNGLLDGASIVTNFFPCSVCAAFIAATGIKRVVTEHINTSNDRDRRWSKSFDESKLIFNTYGIEFVLR